MKSLVAEPDAPTPYSSTTGKSNPGMEIELRNVSFTYPDSEKTALKHVNLKIKRGQVSLI